MEKNIDNNKENSIPRPLKELTTLLMSKLFSHGNDDNFSSEHGIGWQVKQLPDSENQASSRQKKYWHDLRYQKKITSSYSFIGNPHPSYYYKKHFLKQDQSILRTAGIGPNHEGLIIAEGLGDCDVLHSVGANHKQVELASQDSIVHAYYYAQCMHPTKNKWVEAKLASQRRYVTCSYSQDVGAYDVNGLEIREYDYHHETNSYEKSPLAFFECAEKNLRCIRFDPLGNKNDSLLIETEAFVYQLKKDTQDAVLQEIMNVQELVTQHISEKWKLGRSENGSCSYGLEYCNQYPEYILICVKKMKKGRPHDSRTLLLKRGQERIEHIHTFLGKIGFMQAADFVSSVHSFIGGVKRPRNLLRLYTIAQILKRGTLTTAPNNNNHNCMIQ
jgi:hypothetical protein